MKYLVKVKVDGKVETYTTEAPDAAGAMLQAYDKYGVCGVTVSPVVQEAVPVAEVVAEGRYHLAIEWINDGAELCNEGDRLYRAPAPCPVDASIANLDALLAERHASTMDRAQLAALGKEEGDADLDAADHALGEVGKALADAGYDEPDKSLAGSIRALAAERDSLRAALTAREAS